MCTRKTSKSASVNLHFIVREKGREGPLLFLVVVFLEDRFEFLVEQLMVRRGDRC